MKESSLFMKETSYSLQLKLELLPFFIVMQCRDPGTPEHASRMGNSFTYMAIIEYRCNVGYRRSGSGTIVCTENGRWSSKPPTCERKCCSIFLCMKLIRINSRICGNQALVKVCVTIGVLHYSTLD